MDAPDVPRSRDGKQKKRFLGSSTLTSFIKQYPTSSNGKRELRMGSKTSLTDRPTSSSTSRDRRSKHASIGTDDTVRVPSDDLRASSFDHHQPAADDYQDQYGIARTHSRTNSQSRPDYRDFAQSKPMHTPDDDRHAISSPDFSDFEDGNGMPAVPQDFSKTRGLHVPTRTGSHSEGRQRSRERSVASKRLSSTRKQSPSGPSESYPATPDVRDHTEYGTGDRSSAESVFSQETSATSIHTLPPLQTKGPDNSDAQQLEPVFEDDPRSFDLVAPPSDDKNVGMYMMETRSEMMFSAEHLRVIFDDPKLLLKFTGFLNAHRPQSIAILIYYLDALKAIRAINYANAIAEALDPIKGHKFTDEVARPTQNQRLEEKAAQAFHVLVRDDLPAFIAHTWISVVSISIQRRITGTLAPHLREASEGLAEVFCLTDPSRTDNPIVFASEEFTRTTQYGMGYVIGRNCRFLQGPSTNPNSVRRLAEACQGGRETTEVFVNYRRDGSPFMNLLMIAPLMDSRGTTRYYIGAQVDVTGLIKDCTDLDGLAKMVERDQDPELAADEAEARKKDEFQHLSEMFNGAELDTVRNYGGKMHKEYVDESDSASVRSQGQRRLVLQDPNQDAIDDHLQPDSIASSMGPNVKERVNGKLEGVYQHYLLIRPAPSLRILFTSPSLRVPGILQSPFLNRIGGSHRVRADLEAALGEGRGVTAKIRWLTRADADGEGEGRPRWIHCTPLLGHSGSVGVWMVVLVDDEAAKGSQTGRRFRMAPPVAANIGGAGREREEGRGNRYDKEMERRGGAGYNNTYNTNNGGGGGGGGSVSVTRMERDPPYTAGSSFQNPNVNPAAHFGGGNPGGISSGYASNGGGGGAERGRGSEGAAGSSRPSTSRKSSHVASMMHRPRDSQHPAHRPQQQRYELGATERSGDESPSRLSFGLKG